MVPRYTHAVAGDANIADIAHTPLIRDATRTNAVNDTHRDASSKRVGQQLRMIQCPGGPGLLASSGTRVCKENITAIYPILLQ